MPDTNADLPSGSFRVVKSSRKWMFVGGVVLAVLLIMLLLRPFGIGAFLASVLYSMILVAVIVGARAFRAPGESLEPRPWWKATGNTVLSLVLGGVAAWAFIVAVFSVVYVEITDVEGLVVTRSLAVFTAALATFYLHSGVRQAIADEFARRRTADPTITSLLRPPVRLTSIGGKFVYVLAYWLVAFVLGPLTGWLLWPIGYVLELAFVLVGIRIFRGRTEDILPPRAWWRASGRPTASFVLAGLAAATTVYNVVSTVVGDSEAFATPVEGVASVICGAFITALYLNSAIRLRRLTIPSIGGPA